MLKNRKFCGQVAQCAEDVMENGLSAVSELCSLQRQLCCRFWLLHIVHFILLTSRLGNAATCL